MFMFEKIILESNRTVVENFQRIISKDRKQTLQKTSDKICAKIESSFKPKQKKWNSSNMKAERFLSPKDMQAERLKIPEEKP